MYLSPLTVILVAFILGLWIKSYKSNGKNTDAPGPKGWPVIGNLLQLGKKPHETLTRFRKTYGDVYAIKMGSRETIVLSGLQTIRAALVKRAEDFAGRPDFYSFKFIANGNSMGFGDYGPRWKMHRRLAQNALAMFINKKNNPIEESICQEANVLANNLLQNGNNPIDPHTEIYLSVGSIICAICFGQRYKRDDPDFLHLVKMNDEFMAFAGAGNPVDIMPWMRHLTRRSFNRFLGILDSMNQFCNKKRQEHLDTYDPFYTRDVTDCLIQAVDETPNEEKEAVGLTDEHILTTVQELIGAGFDTIASTLQWCVLYMMTNPQIQEMVHGEIRTNVGLLRSPELDDMEKLPFTEACLLETIRISCIFPFALPHSTTRDTQFQGYFIPDKTLVFVNMWSVSHDETIFSEPKKFDPHRFLTIEGEIDRAKLDNFLPFGAGRRKCPGEQLAKMEMFLFFATLMQRLKFSQVPEDNVIVDSKYGLTLKPINFSSIVTKRI
ncbi:cytochrome P450 1A1 [Patella vulgata]|uniref:cytochrome P450 1A1 n=1 Tax=Patella vulgata TaxID=6465 RepID=UPI0021809A72|nr:cytochrome P450 1A1 [Patella vulgata]